VNVTHVCSDLKWLIVAKARVLLTPMSGYPKKYSPILIKKRVYLAHSYSSLHSIYPQDAFDGYTHILPAGEHHIQEVHAINRIRNLHIKTLTFGYLGFNKILNLYSLSKFKSEKKTILFAPSFGPKNFFESTFLRVIPKLLQLEFEIILRLHPIHNIKLIKDQLDKIGVLNHPRLKFDHLDQHSLFTATTLVTDYSGIAVEWGYASNLSGTIRPIVFIDTEPKIRNCQYNRYTLKPIEIEYRNKIGYVVPNDADRIVEQIIERRDQRKLDPKISLRPLDISTFLHELFS
jgi:hypothetical protein